MWIVALVAHAAEPPSTDKAETWGFDTRTNISIDIDDEDDKMVDFAAAERRKPPAATHFHVIHEGQRPFTDAWDPWVAATNERFVVIQLPVLVAVDRASFQAAHPGGLMVTGEWTTGDQSLVVQQLVTARSVLPSDPTFVFLQAALPNTKHADQYRVVVKTEELPVPPDPDAQEVVPPSPPAPPRVRFARSSAYSRP